jgi:hypothetical protein
MMIDDYIFRLKKMSSPPESVISGIPKMWGKKTLQDMDARDGKLFQKEIARRLYGDLKSILIESLTALRESTIDSPLQYVEGLDHCRNWHPIVALDEMARTTLRFQDIEVRVHAVSLLYARILFSEQCRELGEPLASKSLHMLPPRAEMLLRGFFARACSAPWIRNGSFWKMDPFQQDFILREAFNDALAQDCALVTVRDMPLNPRADTVRHEESEDIGQLALLSEDVCPDDSISYFANGGGEGQDELEIKHLSENDVAEDKEDVVAVEKTDSVVGEKKNDAVVVFTAENISELQQPLSNKSVHSKRNGDERSVVSRTETVASRFTVPSRQPIIVRLGAESSSAEKKEIDK